MSDRNVDSGNWLAGMGVFGLAILSVQVFLFFKDGVWCLFSIVDAFKFINSFIVLADFGDWLDVPRSWKGLHVTLDWLPMSAAAIAYGFIVMAGAYRNL